MAEVKEHVLYKCPDTCEGCMFCDGGLAMCVVCNQAEADMEEFCKGYPPDRKSSNKGHQLHMDIEELIERSGFRLIRWESNYCDDAILIRWLEAELKQQGGS